MNFIITKTSNIDTVYS